ncbi:MAG: glycoside hydrolase family 38 C-terminal domain-containing protein [Phycisphaerales bacterium]
MNIVMHLTANVLWLSSVLVGVDPGDWTLYIANDNCPDYTWGYTEEQTRQAFADIVRSHLDEMNRTDSLEPASQDRYNMAVTQEAICFVERYPEREAELVRRIKEGRVFVSPFLCNSLWAFHSTECAIRTLYPARRLEQKWGIAIDVAEHIEEPSLPWGMSPILAGAGVRWLSVPFYNYDSTFSSLKNPPLFLYEGPDGSKLRVILDPWASNKASYFQGAVILRKPESIIEEWLPHYSGLGEVYPLQSILASGTHSDISPNSGSQTQGFAEAIVKYNTDGGSHPKLVNATLPQFCEVVDRVQARKPFLPTLRGCFGHSWDLWPVSLAKCAADMREAERAYLAAETLLAVAGSGRPEVYDATRADRERAEWCWAMLSDHAWNGTDERNKRHNAELRRKWNEELNDAAAKLRTQGWGAMGLTPDTYALTVFNSLSFPRSGLVCLTTTQETVDVASDGRPVESQIVREGGERVLCFVAADVPAFSFRRFELRPAGATVIRDHGVSATPRGLESPYYRLAIDQQTGAVSSLVHKSTGRELCSSGPHKLCQTVFFDGKDHTIGNARVEVIAQGPVLARVRVAGSVEGIAVTNDITVYAELDQVDFDLRVDKPVTVNEQRLCHVFPVVQDGAELRIETTAAVIRPEPQPKGDLLPGADTRRFAVQGFVDASSPQDVGVTIAPLDAFALRMDLGPLAFEALGNDQNYREVIQDQDGVKMFRFRYVLRGYTGGCDNAKTIAWSRSVATPFLCARGGIPDDRLAIPTIQLDPSRAIATCLKPADGDGSGGSVLRLWETTGESGPIRIGLRGFRIAIRTDLLERNQEQLPLMDGGIDVKVNPHGFCSVRLLP